MYLGLKLCVGSMKAKGVNVGIQAKPSDFDESLKIVPMYDVMTPSFLEYNLLQFLYVAIVFHFWVFFSSE